MYKLSKDERVLYCTVDEAPKIFDMVDEFCKRTYCGIRIDWGYFVDPKTGEEEFPTLQAHQIRLTFELMPDRILFLVMFSHEIKTTETA